MTATLQSSLSAEDQYEIVKKKVKSPGRNMGCVSTSRYVSGDINKYENASVERFRVL